MVQVGSRGFAGGGPKKPAIDAKLTDFDVVFVGGLNAACVLKFMQSNDHAQDLKMAIVSSQGKFIEPLNYLMVSHFHLDKLSMESPAISAMVQNWSKAELTSVNGLDPHSNSLSLENGKTFTYKSLVLAPDFNNAKSNIKGLEEMALSGPENKVFVHSIDDKNTVDRNYWHGVGHTHGDFICYSPQVPYNHEASDFYALYYEHFMRQDTMHGRNSANVKIQFWTPNKFIYAFPYANEVALDECHKRGIDVMLGWEMIEVKFNEINQKIAVFKNVDTGEVIEKDFTSAAINPTSKPHQWLSDAGMTDASGGVDVNRYTLQHNAHENVFAFGDCIAGETTRTQHAAMSQAPIVKNNLLKFLQGKDCNGIWDGYSHWPLWLGHSYTTSFSHLHDFEPAQTNHSVPHYGIFSRLHFMYLK